MKIAKKLSKAVIAVAMCMLLTVTAWAANQINVTYTAALNDSELCVNEQAQTVTLTVKADEVVSMDSLTAQVKVPDGWKIVEIANANLIFTENNYNLENGMILWYSSDAENVNNDLLATVTVEIPAGTRAGEYEIEFEIIDISRSWGTPWEDGTVLSATVKIGDHVDADGVDDDHNCDVCGKTDVEGHHGGTATCQELAKCEECGQTYGKVDPNNHVGEQTTSYTNNGGDHTVTVTCECGGVVSTKSEGHTYTDGKCVCGAEEPDVPVTGLKGDVDLDGDVDSTDAVAIFKHAMEAELITNEKALANAEVTSDGVVDSEDAVKVFKYAMEAIDSLD